MENQGTWQFGLGMTRRWKHQYQLLLLAVTMGHSLGIFIIEGKLENIKQSYCFR